MSDIWTEAFFLGVLVSTVRIGTPLLLAALGEMVAETSGILNLSIEGMITLGAFTGFYATYQTESLWLGVLAAAAGGAALALVMAFMSATVKVNQVVAGLALNILGIGLAFYLFRITFETASSLSVPSVTTFEFVEVPLLSDIPWIGEILFTQHWLTYIAIALVPLVWIVLTKTRFGLELRSIGHNPEAVDMRGVNIIARQYAAVVFGGLLAGLAGAFLSLASTGLFFPDMAAGRGWIALAIVIFGNWRASWVLIGSLFFGLIDATQLSLQAVGVDLPYQLLLALPFVLTIVALVLNRSRSRAPLSLAIPYFRGER